MAWYHQYIRGRSPADKDVFLRSEIERVACEPGMTTIAVIKSAFVGSTWYAAVAISAPGAVPYTVAYVFLTGMSRDGTFGYKPMDESVGPCEASCPVGIMTLLTPIDQLPESGHAADWRARVAAERERKANLHRHRRRIVEGTRIRFGQPLRFTNGQSFDRFVAALTQRKGRNTLVFIPLCPDGRRIGGCYRIGQRALAEAVIEVAEVGAAKASTGKTST